MADLSGYSPIYVRTTGNDTTGNGSSGSPYLTAQKAFDSIPKTALLLHFDGVNNSTNFVDSGDFGLSVVANGDAKISTSQSKFGGSSTYFDGTGDYLSGSVPMNFDVDFTIECWVYLNNIENTQSIFTIGYDGNPTGMQIFWHTDNGGGLFWNNISGGTIGPAVVSANEWIHIAAVRHNGTNTFYVNGVSTGSNSSNFTLAHNNFMIGNVPFYEQFIDGYIDDFRITSGLAVYTSNFTPPTAPLTAINDNVVIDCGVGNFGGIDLSHNWPSRISVRGVSSSQSNLGGITGNGTNHFYDAENYENSIPATPGFNVSITSNLSVNLGNIVCIGGQWDTNFYDGNGASGGNITLVNAVCGNITNTGGDSHAGPTAGLGGNISLTGTTAGALTSNGGSNVEPLSNSSAGNGGTITLSTSNVGTVTANGGNGAGYGAPTGSGGAVTGTNSTIQSITSLGGVMNAAYGFGPGNNGGAVTLTACSVGNIVVSGGDGLADSGGGGGSVTLTNSVVGDITGIGGGTPGSGGTSGGGSAVSLTSSTCGNITVSAGSYIGDRGGNGGTVALVDSASGNITSLGGSGAPNSSYSGPGDGGTITITRSACGDIIVNGGSEPDYPTALSVSQKGDGGIVTIIDSTNVGNITSLAGLTSDGTRVGTGGTVTLVGYSTIPNNISAGLVVTTNLKKGRGVNGSNILGLI